METSDTPHWKAAALDALLTSLTDQLESALDIVASASAGERMVELLNHCINATALAKASQTINLRPD